MKVEERTPRQVEAELMGTVWSELNEQHIDLKLSKD